MRRTRVGSDSWASLEVPLAEESERYEIDILSAATVLRTLVTTTPAVTYSAADQIADFGAVQPSLHVRVAQVSSAFGRGTPRDALV